MTATLTEYRAKHGAGWYDPEPEHVHYEARHGHGFGECYRCDTDLAGTIDPLEPDPALCAGCLDEVSHAAETRRYDAAMGASDDGWRAL